MHHNYNTSGLIWCSKHHKSVWQLKKMLRQAGWVMDNKNKPCKVKYQVSDVKCQMSSVRCQVSDVKCQMSSVKY